MSWYLGVLKKYAVFDGRAHRREYWMFVLFNILVAVVLSIIGNIIKTSALSYIYSLAILIPSLAVTVRRLHDTNRTGWWVLIGLVPLVGAIILIVFTVQESQTGQNKYGPYPKTGLPAAG